MAMQGPLLRKGSGWTILRLLVRSMLGEWWLGPVLAVRVERGGEIQELFRRNCNRNCWVSE